MDRDAPATGLPAALTTMPEIDVSAGVRVMGRASAGIADADSNDSSSLRVGP